MTNHFQTWQATRTRTEDVQEAVGFIDDQGVRGGFVYEGGHIEDNTGDKTIGKYFLLIERSDWVSNDLTELEEILWSNWAMDNADIAPEFISGDDLDVFVRGICRSYGINLDDGGPFGMAFSDATREESGWSPEEARDIILTTARTYDLFLRKPAPTA